jgi:hypothetical protein
VNGLLYSQHLMTLSGWLEPVSLRKCSASIGGVCSILVLLYWHCKALLFNERLSGALLLGHLAALAVLFIGADYLYAGEDVLGYVNLTHLQTKSRSSVVGFTYSTMQLVRFGYAVLCLDVLRV